MATTTTTTTTKPSQRGTRVPVGGKKTIKSTLPPQKAAQKKPVPAPLKPQRTTSTPAQKPIAKCAPAAKPPSSAAPKPQPKPRLPTVSTAPKSTSNSTQGSSTQNTGNWINRQVQNRIAGVGTYAGGLVTSVGDGVNKFGEGIANSVTNTTRGWGQGVAGYGNDIKDQVGVGGQRVATAGNPLGLAGMGASGRKPAERKKNAGGKAEGGGKVGKGNHLGL